MQIYEEFALSVILDFKKPAAIEFRKNLGFNHHDLIMTKEQSVLKEIIKFFWCKTIWLQHYFLMDRELICVFLAIILVVEVNKKGHKDRYEHRKNERKNVKKSILIVSLLELIPIKKHVLFLLISLKDIITLKKYFALW